MTPGRMIDKARELERRGPQVAPVTLDEARSFAIGSWQGLGTTIPCARQIILELADQLECLREEKKITQKISEYETR